MMYMYVVSCQSSCKWWIPLDYKIWLYNLTSQEIIMSVNRSVTFLIFGLDSCGRLDHLSGHVPPSCSPCRYFLHDKVLI